MDSLWMIPERKKWWKHSNFYHWNFVPQIPEHFIKRYTKKNWWVFDPFLWSATTAIECENLWRNIVWVDIQESLVNRAKELINSPEIKKEFFVWDSKSVQTKNIIDWYLKINNTYWFDLALLHPPYDNIIKFTEDCNDLSNCKTTEDFYKEFWKVLENTYALMKKWYWFFLIFNIIKL
jgi:16S rRNA G966 N2-methylase RsmD